jgi:glycosyltransferase involved in cell wall biosynthesis
MRIAYLSIGGHIHTERWLSFFVAAGHDVHLITVDPAPIDGVTVHDLRTGIPWKPLHYGAGVLRVRRILSRIQPDLLHVHFLRGYGYWSIFSGVRPRLVTVWGDDVYKAPHLSRLRHWLSRRALADADAITGDSVDILRHVEALGGGREKLHLILWGVDFERFHPVDGAAFRRRWRIPPDAPVVLSTRSFSRDYYNIDVIVDAVPRLRERYPDVCVVFAAYDGEGEDLRKRADALGVGDAVRFVGRIEHAQLPEAIGAADVFVTVPSLDATAVSLLEAMACGKAIVASDLPSNREWIVHGETGFIVPPRDAGALAACALDLLGDEAMRRRFGARCVEAARERAGYTENMLRAESLCEELVRAHRRRA